MQQALNNLESVLKSYGLKLRRKTNSPLPGSYHPECDMTPECGPENARLYASLIGILRWLVELGRTRPYWYVRTDGRTNAGHFSDILKNGKD